MRPQYEIDTKIILGIGFFIVGIGLSLFRRSSVLGYVLVIAGACAFAWGCFRLIRLYKK